MFKNKPKNENQNDKVGFYNESVVVKSYNDAKQIGEFLIKGRSVMMDVSLITSAETIKIIDFLSGVLFTIHGNYYKYGHKKYIFAPEIMDKTAEIEKPEVVKKETIKKEKPIKIEKIEF